MGERRGGGLCGDPEDGGARDSPLRCGCGKLLARWVQDGIEIRCHRCKRAVVITFSEIAGRGGR